MPYYATIKTEADPDKTQIAAFKYQSIRDNMCSRGPDLCAEIRSILAKDLTPADKASAIQCNDYLLPYEDFDFGGPVKYCKVCNTYTLHDEGGNCLVCAKRTYSLTIWVKPSIPSYKMDIFTDPDSFDFKMAISTNAYKPYLFACVAPDYLLNLIDRSKRGILSGSIHAVVDFEIMEDEAVKSTILDNSLSDLNISEIRWHYVEKPHGLLYHFSTKYPPHWQLPKTQSAA